MWITYADQRLVLQDDDKSLIGVVWDVGNDTYELDFETQKLSAATLREISQEITRYVNTRTVSS